MDRRSKTPYRHQPNTNPDDAAGEVSGENWMVEASGSEFGNRTGPGRYQIPEVCEAILAAGRFLSRVDQSSDLPRQNAQLGGQVGKVWIRAGLTLH
jgi:hypothetical protein